MNSDAFAQAIATRQGQSSSMNIAPATGWMSSFSNLAPSVEYAAEVGLFKQGNQAEEIYLVDKGLIKLTRLNEDGNELILGLRSAGSILGAASAIVCKPHPVTAMTLTKCYLKRLPVNTFLDLAKNSNEFCWHIHKLHSLEVYNQAGQLVDLKYLSARQRFEQLILRLAEALGLNNCKGPLTLHLPLKYWEIAQLIGITPEHLSRMLRQMQEEQLILRYNGSLTVTDLRMLYRPLDL